jgi:hypothetical protein
LLVGIEYGKQLLEKKQSIIDRGNLNQSIIVRHIWQYIARAIIIYSPLEYEHVEESSFEYGEPADFENGGPE